MEHVTVGTKHDHRLLYEFLLSKDPISTPPYCLPAAGKHSNYSLEMVNLSIVLIIDMIITCSHSIFVNGMSVLHGCTNTYYK